MNSFFEHSPSSISLRVHWGALAHPIIVFEAAIYYDSMIGPSDSSFMLHVGVVFPCVVGILENPGAADSAY